MENVRTTALIAFSLLVALALLPANAAAQQKSLKEQLVGSWALVSNDNVAPDGTKRQVFGPSPKGIFILDASGHCAQIMFDPSRPKFKGKTRLDGTAEENAAAMRGTSALFGTWSIDEATGTLVTNVNGHVFPNYDGVKLVRKVAISGDQLNVTTLETSSGGTSHLVFRRMK